MEKFEKNNDAIRKERTPGEIIIAARKKKRMSQEQLSLECDVSAIQIGRIERNCVRPKIETIKKLEETLDVQLLTVFLEYWQLLDSGEKKLDRVKLLFCSFEYEISELGLNAEEVEFVLQNALSAAKRKKNKRGF